MPGTWIMPGIRRYLDTGRTTMNYKKNNHKRSFGGLKIFIVQSSPSKPI